MSLVSVIQAKIILAHFKFLTNDFKAAVSNFIRNIYVYIYIYIFVETHYAVTVQYETDNL